MDTTDKAAFVEAIKDMAEVFQVNMTPGMFHGYFEALNDAELIDVEAAIKKAIRYYRFFPKPVEIREFLPQGLVL